ncbi:MAG: hypothetical protein ACRDYE_07425 [Acidimicrobiales bacterium]
MVFGARLAESILGGVEGPAATGAMRTLYAGTGDEPTPVLVEPTASFGWPAGAARVGAGAPVDRVKLRDELQRTMTEGAGVVRDAGSLAAAKGIIGTIGAGLGPEVVDRAGGELANLVTVAAGLLESATMRTETRGAHARSDHPRPDETWRRRIVQLGGGTAIGARAQP